MFAFESHSILYHADFYYNDVPWGDNNGDAVINISVHFYCKISINCKNRWERSN